ncbi:hypothetical protein OM427_19955 [Halomonas sp. 18H]|nr:hypothetical protein [Halomonas sp. 18H]MCW4151795.1 hypothetical protein [Halomonas sp. 18H]
MVKDADSRGRLKLLALFVVFALPMAMAWAMVEWRIGVPDERTAHGQLHTALPRLAEWPLPPVEKEGADDWLMVFDCDSGCATQADRWWRVHRALGRDAHRVSRLRIAEASGKALPGERIVGWKQRPAWASAGVLWILDHEGRPVLSYAPGVDASHVLEDIERLLELNPEPSVTSMDDA